MIVSTAIASLTTQLTQIALRNTASTVITRIKAIRSGKQHEEQINELSGIINELLDDRNQLIGIAQAFGDELVSQSISESDIQFITETVIPTVERLLATTGQSDAVPGEVVDALKSLVSVEMLTVLQLVGFNYKRAIGEPLTRLVEGLIMAQVQGAENGE